MRERKRTNPLSVKVMQSLEDLHHVARNEMLRKISKRLERGSKRSVLDVPAKDERETTSQRNERRVGEEREKKKNSLQDNIQRIIIPHHPLVLDDARMRQPLEQFHLLHELSDILLLQTFESNPLDRVHRSVPKVESSVDGSELTFSDAVSEAL